MIVALLALALTAPGTDTYPRQPVDVEHYRFELALSDSSDVIRGRASVSIRLLKAGMTEFDLDLVQPGAGHPDRGMTVTAAAIGGTPIRFRQHDDRLALALAEPAAGGQLVTVTIDYSGVPVTGLLIKPNRNGRRTFFSDNWPDKVRNWLPTIDHIADKSTMEFVITAPAVYQVVANGLRVEETDLPGAMRRTVWRESVPIAPWLFALGVAQFAVERTGEYRGAPIETWVFAEERDKGFYDFAVPTRDALAFYSEWIGPYSYEKLANVQSNSVSGGMEAASSIFYSQESVSGTRSIRWRNVVIHEIAHQWFGNAITEADWDHVWLSEGFATYFTLLFQEHAYGRDEFVAGLKASRETVANATTKDPLDPVIHVNLSDMSKVTSSLTYQKGAWTLHMLRERIGTEKFWTGIRNYYRAHQNGLATTDQFRAEMEAVSGQDLKPFFDQWLTRGGMPALAVTWTWDAKARQIAVDIAQTQAGPAFVFPLDLGIAGADGKTRIETVNVTSDRAHFVIAAESKPATVTLDPETRLLFRGTIAPR